MRELLFPLNWFYLGVTGTRNWLYNHNLKRAHTVGARVISIGNLTTGGTGKTPVTLAVLALLKERGYTCGAISRGFGRASKGVRLVEPMAEVSPGANAGVATTAGQDPREFGDEPVLIKTTFPEMPVAVGEKRVLAARKLLEAQPVQFLVSDDSFQHRALKRDLNLLLLDSTEDMRNYRVLPVGHGRESLVPALRRADYFVLTKTNLAESDQLKDLIFWLKEKSDKPVLLAAYAFKGFKSMNGQIRECLRDSAYLVSGIAKPETIEKTIAGRVEIVKHKSFGDHHLYTHLEIEAILDEASSLHARWIITTAKDATKLSRFRGLRERLWVIDLAIQFEGDTAAFYADIDRLARASD